LFGVREARGAPRLLSRASKYWEQNSRQNRNNGDDNEQLDERERSSFGTTVHFIFSFPVWMGLDDVKGKRMSSF